MTNDKLYSAHHILAKLESLNLVLASISGAGKGFHLKTGPRKPKVFFLVFAQPCESHFKYLYTYPFLSFCIQHIRLVMETYLHCHCRVKVFEQNASARLVKHLAHAQPHDVSAVLRMCLRRDYCRHPPRRLLYVILNGVPCLDPFISLILTLRCG